MLVVSDTSPLLNLAAVGRADLLGSLYEAVVIPPAVQKELASLSRRDSRFASAALLPPTVRVQPLPSDVDTVAVLAELHLLLHPGEAEALALAAALSADLLLIDEFAARRLARRRGVPTQGLLGVLVEAKRRGLLAAVAPVLDQLQTRAGFWVGAELRESVLHSVGEATPKAL
jgi:predicted nucleic acid-binding protein